MMELVGMLGVSFSKPPCMYSVWWSYAQMVWRKRWIEWNFFHSEFSVS